MSVRAEEAEPVVSEGGDEDWSKVRREMMGDEYTPLMPSPCPGREVVGRSCSSSEMGVGVRGGTGRGSESSIVACLWTRAWVRGCVRMCGWVRVVSVQEGGREEEEEGRRERQ